MEKKFIDLQMFADEGNTDPNTTTTTTEGNTDPEPTANEPKAKYTDEDVNKILDRKFAEWQKKKDKEKSEAKRLGEMTAEERANERLKTLEDRIHEYETREARAEMMKEARAILQDKELHVSDALLGNLIADDAETTKEVVETFVNLVQELVDKEVKNKLRNEPPKKGNPTSGMTKEQIMGIKNRADRQKAIEENMDLFK